LGATTRLVKDEVAAMKVATGLFTGPGWEVTGKEMRLLPSPHDRTKPKARKKAKRR
jgi:hypothetical protein